MPVREVHPRWRSNFHTRTSASSSIAADRNWRGRLSPHASNKAFGGTSAHSTLVLDEANSTAVLLNGQIGKVEEVDFTREAVRQGGRRATKLEAAHNGYVARYGLRHRRILMLLTTEANCAVKTCWNRRARRTARQGRLCDPFPSRPRYRGAADRRWDGRTPRLARRKLLAIPPRKR